MDKNSEIRIHLFLQTFIYYLNFKIAHNLIFTNWIVYTIQPSIHPLNFIYYYYYVPKIDALKILAFVFFSNFSIFWYFNKIFYFKYIYIYKAFFCYELIHSKGEMGMEGMKKRHKNAPVWWPLPQRPPRSASACSPPDSASSILSAPPQHHRKSTAPAFWRPASHVGPVYSFAAL